MNYERENDVAEEVSHSTRVQWLLLTRPRSCANYCMLVE
jgi:hypothetical protein